MRKLAMLLCCLSGVAMAQSTWTGEREKIFDELGALLMAGQIEEGEAILARTEKRVREEKDTLGLILCYTAYINIHLTNETYVDSILDAMELLLPAAGRPKDYIEYYIDRANVARLRANHQLQISFIDTALGYALENGDTSSIGVCYIELASAYQKVENYRAALEMSGKARACFIHVEIPWYVASTWSTDGLSYAGLQIWDSAEIGLEKASAIQRELGNQDMPAFNDALIGKYRLERGDVAGAREKLLPARNVLFKKGEMRNSQLPYNEIWSWLARLYLAEGNNDEAYQASMRAYQLSDSLGQARVRLVALQTLVNVILSRDPKALAYYRESVKLQEQVYKSENTRAIVEFERKYQAEEAQRKVVELRQAALEAELRAANLRTVFFLILALAVVVGVVVLLLVLRARYRTRNQIAALNRKALQLQINPHFFFNVLNSINGYIVGNEPKEAQFYLAKFARLMRISLENSRLDTVDLGQEIDLLEAYLHLEKLRQDHYDFEVICPDELRAQQVPPLLIQPLVENAVLHAFPASMPFRGKITVTASAEEGSLAFEVVDNGVGIAHDANEQEKSRTSLAISILSDRLEAFGRHKGRIEFLKSFPDRADFPGTRVRVQIPVLALV